LGLGLVYRPATYYCYSEGDHSGLGGRSGREKGRGGHLVNLDTDAGLRDLRAICSYLLCLPNVLDNLVLKLRSVDIVYSCSVHAVRMADVDGRDD
jgi:hypothetical protein